MPVDIGVNKNPFGRHFLFLRQSQLYPAFPKLILEHLKDYYCSAQNKKFQVWRRVAI